MKYIHADLGQRSRGDVVQVNLQGTEANVLIMDSSNFSSFRSRGTYREAYGGTWKRSPVHLTVPRSGHWYGVVYIPPGYRGQVRAGFQVLGGQLPPIRETYSRSPLGAIRQAADEYAESIGVAPDDKEYDVFISHAGEDKADIVRPLAVALRDLGLVVWYDEFELKLGDSLRRKIDRGLVASRFGVVVLSPSFFEKGWPNYELDGLVTREVVGGQPLILPLWHNVTRDDVVKYSPSLADKVSRPTADISIADLAAEIAGVVRPMDQAA
ncbi:MAG TPA: DUF1883 domain-containing protein [Candidatus Limnocylindrales bacterium]|nr:DUF1883 domain-containing protein [Candidatus Limnocylindrales bacterium]